jgi:quercetin dioxygenase-like cupin family protein
MNALSKSISAILFLTIIMALAACNNYKNQKIMAAQEESTLFPTGNKLPNEWFSGNAFLTPLLAKDKNNDYALGSITFEPGARTNWHTHTKGQVLIVTEGEGFYQEKGKSAQSIKKAM